MFLLLCILAMFAIHAITQIASKTEKLWSAKKHHHNFAFWCGMLCEESGEGGASGTALTGQGILSLSLLSPLRGGKIQLGPLAVIRSRFGFAISRSRTAAACLSRCIRHWRRSKAKPLRGSRGRSRAVHGIAAVHNSSFRIPHSHSSLNFLPVGQKNSSTCTG